MDTFKNLVCRHLVPKPAVPPSPQPTTRRHSIIGKALARAAAVAVESVAAALGHCTHNYNHSRDDDPYYGRERTLPPNHPHNVRVRRMAANLFAAACDDKTYVGQRSPLDRIRRPFYGVDWRVAVIDANYVNAFSWADGGIVVSAGFVRYMQKDAHIATVLGHEVGHVIARHGWKYLRNRYWVGVLVNMVADLLDLPRDRLAQDNWESIFMRPCLFRQEYEADHLGLLLQAAAGYDPRVAPSMYVQFAKLEEAYLQSGDDDDNDLPTHPPSMKRAQRLSQAKIMDEALDLYRQAVKSGKLYTV